MMKLRKHKLAKRLADVGCSIDTSYVLYVNNLDPISFPTKDAALKYLSEFRSENVIFKLQIYRIETYSL